MPIVKTSRAGAINGTWFAQFDTLEVSDEMAKTMQAAGLLLPEIQNFGDFKTSIFNQLFICGEIQSAPEIEIGGYNFLKLVDATQENLIGDALNSGFVTIISHTTGSIFYCKAVGGYDNGGNSYSVALSAKPDWLSQNDLICLMRNTAHIIGE